VGPFSSTPSFLHHSFHVPFPHAFTSRGFPLTTRLSLILYVGLSSTNRCTLRSVLYTLSFDSRLSSLKLHALSHVFGSFCLWLRRVASPTYLTAFLFYPHALALVYLGSVSCNKRKISFILELKHAFLL
jgi:hypothetical protein